MALHEDIDHSGLVVAGAWTAYTPALTAATTNPTLGSSTVTGRYMEIGTKTIALYIEFNVTTGGAWNAGSGTYQFSLPSGMATVASRRQCIAAHLSDSGNRRYPGVGVISGATSIITLIALPDIGGTHTVTDVLPPWATGDYLILQGVIEIA